MGTPTVDTYAYAGTGETVAQIDSLTSGVTTKTRSVVSLDGSRLGVVVGASAVNWFLPDLHGSIAASLDAAESSVLNALRYDAYGQTLATGGAGGAVGTDKWKYQGRLDLSPSALGTPLYDLGARFYSPGLGTFTQLSYSRSGGPES